jgi:hypothetical protein
MHIQNDLKRFAEIAKKNGFLQATYLAFKLNHDHLFLKTLSNADLVEIINTCDNKNKDNLLFDVMANEKYDEIKKWAEGRLLEKRDFESLYNLVKEFNDKLPSDVYFWLCWGIDTIQRFFLVSDLKCKDLIDDRLREKIKNNTKDYLSKIKNRKKDLLKLIQIIERLPWEIDFDNHYRCLYLAQEALLEIVGKKVDELIKIETEDKYDFCAELKYKAIQMLKTSRAYAQ